jgi:hypothetical protein
VLNEPFSVVVAPYAVVRPYVKPRTVGFEPPVAVIVPLAVAVVVVMLEAAWVVRVGTEGGGAGGL